MNDQTGWWRILMARVDDFLTDPDTLAVADLGNRKTMKPTMMPKNWRRFWLDSAQHGFA